MTTIANMDTNDARNFVYRALSTRPAPGAILKTRSNTPRPSANVPAVVDNLWEWKRADGFPSRRHAAFANARPEICPQQNGVLCRVALLAPYRLCQVTGLDDSKGHQECSSLPRFLGRTLGESWFGFSLDQKSWAGRLWIPCLSKSEIELLFATVEPLRQVRDELWQLIRYWEGVRLLESPLDADECGELFFEAHEGYQVWPMK